MCRTYGSFRTIVIEKGRKASYFTLLLCRRLVHVGKSLNGIESGRMMTAQLSFAYGYVLIMFPGTSVISVKQIPHRERSRSHEGQQGWLQYGVSKQRYCSHASGTWDAWHSRVARLLKWVQPGSPLAHRDAGQQLPGCQTHHRIRLTV